MSGANLTDPREVFLLASFKDYRAHVGTNLSDKMWMECARQALDAWDDFRKKRKQARAKRINKFVPPAAAEVEAYSIEIGWPMNGEDWILHYAKKDWKYTEKTRMCNWKLAVQTWKRSKWKTPNPPATPAAKVFGIAEPEGWRVTLIKALVDTQPEWAQSALASSWENMPRHWKPKIAEICQQQKANQWGEDAAAHPRNFA